MDFALPKEALDAAATPDPTAAPVAPPPAPTAPPAPATPLPGVPAPFTLPGSATAGGFQLPGDAEQAGVQDSAADDKFNPVEHYLKHGETPEAMDFAAKVAEYKAKHPDAGGKKTGGFLKGAWDEVANTGADIKDAFTGKLKTDPKSGLGSFAQGVAHATTVALQSIADTPKSVQVYNWSSEGQPAWIKRMGEKIAEHDRLLAVDQKEKDAFVKGGGKIQDYQSFIPEDAKVDAEDRADYDRVVGRQFEVAGILRSGALKGGENAIKAGRWAHGLFSGGDAALDTDDWKQRIAVDAELHKTADNIRQGKGSNAGAPGWIAPEPEVPDETRARLLREGQFTEKGIEQGSVVADPTNILAMEGLRLPIVSKATGAALKLTGKAAEFTGGIADKVLGHGAGKVLATGGGVLAGYEVTKRAVAGDLRPLGVALALLTARVALKRGGALMGEAGGELMNPEAFNSRAATAAAKAGEAEAAGAGPAALEEGSPMGQAVDNFFNPADNAAAASRVARRTIQGAGVGVTGAIPYAILSDNPEQAGHAVGGGVAFGGTLGPLGAGLENPTLNRAMEINKAATRILADRGAATTFEDPALQKAHNDGVKDLSYSTRTYFDALKGLLSGFKSKAGNPMNIAVLNAPDYAAQLAKRAPGADPDAAAKSRAFYDSATGTILVNKGEGPNGLRVDSAGHETGHFITDEVMGQMGRAYGDALRNAVEGGLFDGNAPTPEFQRFIDDYNSKTPGTKIPSGKSVNPGDILRHRAVSEYLAETTRNILGDPTPGKFILPKDVSDKMADRMVKMYGDAAGAKQDIFSRTDLPTIHAALADVIFDLGRGMRPQQRRAGSPRRPTGEAVTPQDGSAPSQESGAAPREPGTAGEPQNPAMPGNPAPPEPFSDIGLTTEQVDAARDFHVNFPGMEPGAQRANKKKGLPAKSKDARATELGQEWDDAFDKYAEYLRTNGLKAPKDPQTFHQAVIDFYLKSDAGANPNIERPGTPPPTDSTGPQKPASSIESKTAILEQPEPGKAPEGQPEPGALEPQPLNEDTIRQRMTEAENKVVQSPEFAKKRSEKTRAAMQKEARVRAALEAAHEASADNPDALRKVTDEDGVTSYKGRLDPETIPAHKVLLDEMGITPDGQAAISLLDNQVGKTVYLDYKSALKTDPADVTGAQRAEEQAANTPDQRRAGAAATEQKGKAFHVLGFKVFPKKGSVTLFGFSPDKWVSNVGKLVEHLKAEGQPTGYNGVNDALLTKDMEAVVDNHKNGWKGDGSAPVEGAQATEGYTPQVIPPERFNVLNASLNIDVSTKRGSDSAATEAGALAAQERAIDNGVDVDAETGDVNPVRAFINKSGKLVSTNAAGKVREGTAQHLETVYENIAPDLVTGLSDTPGGRQIVRPVGFKGDPGFPVRKGIPRGDYSASGFMPHEGGEAGWTDGLREHLDEASRTPDEIKAYLKAQGVDAKQHGDYILADGHVIDTFRDEVKPAPEWINEADSREIGQMADALGVHPDFNKDFQAHPEPLYHATPEDNIAGIKGDGIKRASKTRGISNRRVGDAVYTSSDIDELSGHGSYGDHIFEIDTAAMKRDGVLPEVSREPVVEEAELAGAVARKLGVEDYEPYTESDMSPSTVVLHGDIPAKYLKPMGEWMPDEGGVLSGKEKALKPEKFLYETDASKFPEAIKERARKDYEERNASFIAKYPEDAWDKIPQHHADEFRTAAKAMAEEAKAAKKDAAAAKKRGALEAATPKRDVIRELKDEGVLHSDDIPEDMPASSQAYFELGHDDPNGKNWIYDPSSRSVKSKTGGTHGMNWGHDVADRSFKGWFDTERNVISVAFPESARRKLSGEPTVDDIPTDVYTKLKAKFGKDAAMVAFMPDEGAPKDAAKPGEEGVLSSSIKTKRPEVDGPEGTKWVQKPTRVLAGDELVNVNVAEFDKLFAKDGGFYIPPGGGGGEIKGRIKGFTEWLKKGEPIEAPEVDVSKEGTIGFANGRHRYSYFRDRGAEFVPMTMDAESAKKARELGLEFMPDEGGVERQREFKTDEGEFSVHDVEEKPRGRSDMFTVHRGKDGFTVRNALVPESMQRKGIATDFYRKMNAESIAETGQPLRSTQPRTLKSGAVVHELSPDAIALWDSFVEKGLAEKRGEKDYAFKRDAEFMPHEADEKFKRVESGKDVDGLVVRPKVPNMGSIESSGLKALKGVREVPMDLFDADPKDLFGAADDRARAQELADQIEESGEINPLIVGIDAGGPYIVEGAHRLGALFLRGAKSFPAIVAVEGKSHAVSKKGSGSTPYFTHLEGSDKPISQHATAEEAWAAADQLDNSQFMPNEAESKAVDEAARKAGYTIKAAHSTNAKEFHEFRTSGLSAHFGTEDAAKDRADHLRKFATETVGRKHDEPRVMPVYLKMENPLRLPDLADLHQTERGEIVPHEEASKEWLKENASDPNADEEGYPHPMAWESDTDFSELLLHKGIITTDEFWDVQYDKDAAAQLLKEKGYDGIVYKNSVEGGGKDSYIIFDPNQVKSAEAIQRDATGKEIPLSERFNPDKPDIRFMPKEGSSIESKRDKEPKPARVISKILAEDHGVDVRDATPEQWKAAMEQRRKEGENLIAVHNVSADKLDSALELGGVAVPSVAITKKDAVHTGFGEISLIGDRQMIDPQVDRTSRIFEADIYSIRHPQPTHAIDTKAMKALVKEMRDKKPAVARDASAYEIEEWSRKGREGNRERAMEDARRSDLFKSVFTEEHSGKKVEVKQIPEPLNDESISGTKAFREYAKSAEEYPDVFRDQGTPAYQKLQAAVEAAWKEKQAEHPLLKKLENPYMDSGSKDSIELKEGADPSEIGMKKQDVFQLLMHVSDANHLWEVLPKVLERRGVEDPIAAAEWIRDHADVTTENAERKLLPRVDQLVSDAKKLKNPRMVDDKWTARQEVDKYVNAHRAEYEQWVQDKMDPLFNSPTLKGKGGKKINYTLDNIVDAMSRRAIKGIENNMTASLGQSRARAAREFKSVEEIRAAQDQIVSSEEFEAARKEVDQKFNKATDGMLSLGATYSMGSYDTASQAIGDYLVAGDKGEASMRGALARRFGRSSGAIPEHVVSAFLDAARALKAMPTEYFEGKLQRAVKFSDFRGAAVPDTAPTSVAKKLRDQGIDVELYNPREEGDRARVVERVAERNGVNFMPHEKVSVNLGGKEVSTGEPVEFTFLRGKTSATSVFGIPTKDSAFDRGYEPSGRYMTDFNGENPDPQKMETGSVKFENPLVVPAGSYGDPSSWKRTLSVQFGGKTGKELSKAIIAAGYDGIVTVERARSGETYTGEIVDLTTFDPRKAKYMPGESDGGGALSKPVSPVRARAGRGALEPDDEDDTISGLARK